MSRTIRPFAHADGEYEVLAALQHSVYPDYPFSATEMRHEDETWDHARFFQGRWVLEEDGQMIGWLQVNHSRHSFVPTTYWMDLGVRSDGRRQGHGTALYEMALGVLGERSATRIRSGTKESMSDGLRFLLNRGFTETKRDWESRLFLESFDFERYSGARERITDEGVRISTLAAEMARDPEALRKAFELHDAIHNDVPSMDAPTPMDFGTWRQRAVEGPNAINEAYFIAVDREGRYLGLSELERSSEPTFLWQGLTGTRRDARGRGIAMALKLETVRYARERGVEHIKTWNDQRNRPMLAINEALGFVKEPAWTQFQKDL